MTTTEQKLLNLSRGDTITVSSPHWPHDIYGVGLCCPDFFIDGFKFLLNASMVFAKLDRISNRNVESFNNLIELFRRV